jgi:hypothetical protein
VLVFLLVCFPPFLSFQNLLGKLDGERTRWEVTARELREAVTTLPVKIMMAAAYTTYVCSLS